MLLIRAICVFFQGFLYSFFVIFFRTIYVIFRKICDIFQDNLCYFSGQFVLFSKKKNVLVFKNVFMYVWYFLGKRQFVLLSFDFHNNLCCFQDIFCYFPEKFVIFFRKICVVFKDNLCNFSFKFMLV